LLPPESPQTAETMSVGITLTPTFTMSELNINYLEVLLKEAEICRERGDIDDSVALCHQLIEHCYPFVLEQAKRDRTFIFKLVTQTNSKDKVLAEEAKIILQYLKNNGIEL